MNKRLTSNSLFMTDILKSKLDSPFISNSAKIELLGLTSELLRFYDEHHNMDKTIKVRITPVNCSLLEGDLYFSILDNLTCLLLDIQESNNELYEKYILESAENSIRKMLSIDVSISVKIQQHFNNGLEEIIVVFLVTIDQHFIDHYEEIVVQRELDFAMNNIRNCKIEQLEVPI